MAAPAAGATAPVTLAAAASAASGGGDPGDGALALAAADTTEDTGRINVWFRMQNPTFYNTKVYNPLADLNQANKLDRYIAKIHLYFNYLM